LNIPTLPSPSPHIEYENSVWHPYKKGDIENIEKIKRRATKLVKEPKKLSYEERLKNTSSYSKIQKNQR